MVSRVFAQARRIVIVPVPWSCKLCTPIGGQPSWWSWPSCGRRAWSDLRNRTAYGRNGAYPGRTEKPCQPCTLGRFSMCIGGLGCGLLTGDLVLGVLLAVLALAVGTAGLGNVDLNSNCQPVSVAGVRCAQRWVRVSVECSMSERGGAWWPCGGVPSVTDGGPCRSSWRVGGRLADSRGESAVVDSRWIRRVCVRGWARGRLAAAAAAAASASAWALDVAAHSLCAGLAAAPMSSIQPSNVRAQQPCPAHRPNTHTHTHTHTGSHCPAASQPASPPARHRASQPSQRTCGWGRRIACARFGRVRRRVSFVEAEAEASITHAAIFSRGIRACLHLPS